MIQRNAKIKSVGFSVLNFLEFFGTKDKWTDSHCLGATTLIHEKLQIQIIQDAAFAKNEKQLKETDGYCVTHSGVIEYCDGATISVSEVENILRGLRAFLSFARGAGCGLTLVKATHLDGGQAFFEWGSRYTDPWSRGSNTWLPTIPDGGENLSQAFSGFWSLYERTDWKDVICRAIDLYVHSKNDPFHVGIILVQAALESLCSKIGGPKKKKESMGEFLSRSIRKMGFRTSIPSSCNNLDKFFRKAYPLTSGFSICGLPGRWALHGKPIETPKELRPCRMPPRRRPVQHVGEPELEG